MTVATNNHVVIDDNGVARIDGTRMKVIHLVKAMVSRQLNTEQLRDEFPDLSLAQIHAALSYYYDHQAQIDAQIKEDTTEYEVERSNAGPSPLREKIRKSTGQ